MIEQFAQYTTLISPEGRAEIIRDIQNLKREHGKEWLKILKRDYPDFVFIVDLVANYDADLAFLKFKELIFEKIDNSDSSYWVKVGKREIARKFLSENRENLTVFHGELKAEIDKPRF